MAHYRDERLLSRNERAPHYQCDECAHYFTWEVEPTNCPECGGQVTREPRTAAGSLD